MLIRRPVADVFEAVVDPEMTTKFWFTRSTGKLEEGKRVRWDWEMYGQSADVEVDEVVENERIVLGLPAYEGEGRTTVVWRFTPHPEGTYVEVANTGFGGDAESVARQAVDATGGFTLVLAGMKAWLEPVSSLVSSATAFRQASSTRVVRIEPWASGIVRFSRRSSATRR